MLVTTRNCGPFKRNHNNQDQSNSYSKSHGVPPRPLGTLRKTLTVKMLSTRRRREIHGLLLQDLPQMEPSTQPGRVQNHRGMFYGGIQNPLWIRRDDSRAVQHRGAYGTLQVLKRPVVPLDDGVRESGAQGDYHGSGGGHSLVGSCLPGSVAAVYAHARGLFVLVEVGFQGEGLSASPADVGLGVGMGLDVGAEVRFVREGLAADGAFEGFFSWKKELSLGTGKNCLFLELCD